MQANEKISLIERFYTAFQKKDYASMIACYHAQVEFSDPVFVGLKGKQPGAMWHMLRERGKDMTLVFSNVRTEGEKGFAHWDADYNFSTTGRQVHNVIDATFEFKDGKIIRHNDVFNFWRWSSMALGTSGMLLGWSPFLQNKVRGTAMKGLMAFIEKHPEYQ